MRPDRRHVLISLIGAVWTQTAGRSLDSANSGESTAELRALFEAGKSSIDRLILFRGNKRVFLGVGLGKATASCNMRYKDTQDNRRQGKIVTVEVAALYIICAIVAGDLEFASCPYLVDERLPEEEQLARNTSSTVNRAWKAVFAWRKSPDHHNLRESPIKSAGLSFWGSE
jgi:hypothetical protein